MQYVDETLLGLVELINSLGSFGHLLAVVSVGAITAGTVQKTVTGAVSMLLKRTIDCFKEKV